MLAHPANHMRHRTSYARPLTVVALVAIATFAYSEANANGFGFPDNTTKSVGRGGAYMLEAAGPEMIYFNPALLTRLEGFQTTLDLNISHLDMTFHRAGIDPSTIDSDNPDGSRFKKVENESPPFPAPMLFLSHDFGLKDFAFGIGAYGPSAYGTRRFERGGPQRYILEKAELLEVFPSLAVAYQHGGFRVGATLQAAMLFSNLSLKLSTALGDPATADADDDAQADLKDLQDIKPTGIVGVAYDVSRELSFGLSYKLPVKLEGEGTITVDFPEKLDFLKPSLTDDKVTLKVYEADVLSASARYAYLKGDEELFDVELMVTYEFWSRNKAFAIDPAGDVTIGTGTPPDVIPLETINLPKDWKDTVSVRLGSDWATAKWLTMRAGGFYETGAVPSSTTHLDFAGWDRIGVGTGLTAHVSDFDLDLGYMFIYMPDREVTDGIIRMEAPLVADEAPVVNNGDWTAQVQIFSLGLTYRFDGPRTSTTPAINDLEH